MTDALPKYGSLDIRRKANSHTKLPRLPSVQINKVKETKTNKNTLISERKSASIQKAKNLLLLKLQPIQNEVKKPKNNNKTAIQQNNQSMNIRQSYRIQRRDSPTKIINEDADIRRSFKQKKIEDQQKSQSETQQRDESLNKKIALNTMNSDALTKSENSLKQGVHPIMSKISPLMSKQTLQQVFGAKVYDRKLLGEVSSIWWCAVDSLFISLQKIVKVKKHIERQSPDKGKREKNTKSPDKDKIRESERGKVEESNEKEQAKIVKGKTLTKVKPTIEMAKVYSYLQQQITSNEKYLMKFYEDPNHISLILEALFYEKALIYLIGSIRKWNHPEEQFHIHNLGVEILPIIIQTRKLIIDNLIQAVENEVDAKMKKPKYIAKEKKLIQISKSTSAMKFQFDKCLQNLGSPNRYRIFQYGNGFREYVSLCQLQGKWRNCIFDVPLAPYLPNLPTKKPYLLIIQPLNILYKYNKKQETLLIDPQVEYFFSKISTYFEIVFFTHTDKELSLLNFMGVLEKLQVLGILDKGYLSFKGGKTVKDISKIGTGYNLKHMLILDDKNNHNYYDEKQENVHLIETNHSHMKICRVKGKLLKKQEENEDFLKNLIEKLLKCAQRGGNWDSLNLSELN